MTVSAASRSVAIHPRRRHYPNAPIVETVLEIVAESKQGHNLEQLKALGKKEPAYGQVRETTEFYSQFGVSSSGGMTAATGQQRLVGYAFVDEVGGRVFGARVDRFSFSKLHPYTEWESVRSEARRLWERYARSLKIRKVKRVGLRYVNRLDLPGPSVELKDWLLTGPEVAGGMHQNIASFAMQMSIPQPDLPGTMVTIREVVVESPKPDIVSVVLDIDVSRSGAGLDTKNLWEAIDVLHDRENLVFECSITDRVRERIG